jgi:hypothetical protein
VVKEDDAVDGQERLRVEVAALGRVAGEVLVPQVVLVDPARCRLVLTAMPGRHGQELVDEGFASLVLAAAGRTLRRLHRSVPGLVHGDYGPQNLLLEVAVWEVSAVLDWEFAHEGDPVEDLAWAEWIVRMHHAEAVGAPVALFAGYGSRQPWGLRQDMMLQGVQRSGSFVAAAARPRAPSCRIAVSGRPVRGPSNSQPTRNARVGLRAAQPPEPTVVPSGQHDRGRNDERDWVLRGPVHIVVSAGRARVGRRRSKADTPAGSGLRQGQRHQHQPYPPTPMTTATALGSKSAPNW